MQLQCHPWSPLYSRVPNTKTNFRHVTVPTATQPEHVAYYATLLHNYLMANFSTNAHELMHNADTRLLPDSSSCAVVHVTRTLQVNIPLNPLLALPYGQCIRFILPSYISQMCETQSSIREMLTKCCPWSLNSENCNSCEMKWNELTLTCHGWVSLWSSRFRTTLIQLRREASLSRTQDSMRIGLSDGDHSSFSIANSSARPILTVHSNPHFNSSVTPLRLPLSTVTSQN